MKTLAERLIWARTKKGISQEALAKNAGVSQGSIGHLESGLRFSSRKIISIAESLDVDPVWLSEGKGSPDLQAREASHEIDLTNNPEYPAIRRVKLKISAGISGFAVDLEGEDHVPIVFGKYWYQSRGFKPEKLIAVRVRGQSMEPGMHENDTVVINTADTTPVDGECFAVNYEGEAGFFTPIHFVIFATQKNFHHIHYKCIDFKKYVCNNSLHRNAQPETAMNVMNLQDCEVSKITETFIAKLADADHNFFEDMGHHGESNTDRDSIIIELARTWKDSQELVQKLTGGTFWNEMKRLALGSYESGHLSI